MKYLRNNPFLRWRGLPVSVLALAATVVIACGSTDADGTSTPPAESQETPSDQASTTPASSPALAPTTEPTQTAFPGFETDVFEELSPLPELRSIDPSIDLGFDERETLPRDAINPIYSPKFVSPDDLEQPLLEDELVMGLNINGDARAYPVGIMRFREIVNDEVGGVPLLVTW